MARRNSLKTNRTDPFGKSGASTDSLERLRDFGSSNSLGKSDLDSDDEDGINVVVRVRPLNVRESKGHDQNVISFPGNGQLLLEGLNVISSTNGIKTKLFSFNVVFEPQATQADMFNYCGIKRLIEMAIEGFNTTCFCYGQTGSGKTHTLTGPPGLFLRKKLEPFSADHGLVYRAFLHLFQLLRDKSDMHFVLKASFLEIYNEKVIDLLNPGSTQKPLSVRWSKKSGSFYVENLFTIDCEELDDLQAVLEEGMRNRAVSSHRMNENSGRSHTILTVHITSEQQMSDSDVFITKHGKINFVDLAGSEMTKKTNSSGKTLKEATNINKSLMVLGYCISLLSDPRKKSAHVPYRDSKLTKLLSDSLAGSGVTLMIACVSPALSNVCETLNTLRYAARAKHIRTKPIIVMDPRESLIVTLKREAEALRNENNRLRRALDMNKDAMENLRKSTEMYEILKKATPLNVDKLAKMTSMDLVELIKHYAVENDTLRKENSDLFHSRDILMRDHQLVCRENERLIKKVESNKTLPDHQPIRKSFSADAELGQCNTNPGNSKSERIISLNTTASGTTMLPNSVLKELDKIAIVDSLIKKKPEEIISDGRHDLMNKMVLEKIVHHVYGSPLSPLSRSTSAESVSIHDIEQGFEKSKPIKDSEFRQRQLHLPKILQQSHLRTIKNRFRNPFRNAVSMEVR